jgi:prepilin-type N-terminal cleavage/methylation domain-containing protein
VSRRGMRGAGFTLIEVLAAVFLTSVVLALAMAVYLNLSSAVDAARDRVRESRHALAILDRVARDLQTAYLLEKPLELDPLFHPWLFLAESHTQSQGSDRLKFITRSHRPRNPMGHGSDLAVVSYVLEHGDDGHYALTRSLSPGLPEGLDREFPASDDSLSNVVAEGLSSFGVRFMTDEQEWVDEWDSSLIVESGSLPLAAEIDLALAPPDAEQDDFGEFGSLDEDDLDHFKRRVLLPMRPVSLELQMLAASTSALGAAAEEDDDDDDDDEDDDGGGGGGSSQDATGMTVGQCLDTDTTLRDALLAQFGSFGDLGQYLDQPASKYQGQLADAGFQCQ